MARKEFERLRDVAQEIATQHPQGSTGDAARAVERRAARLLDDPQFLQRVRNEAALRRNLDQVHGVIARVRQGDPAQFRRYLERVDVWAASLAGDPTTDPPDDP